MKRIAVAVTLVGATLGIAAPALAATPSANASLCATVIVNGQTLVDQCVSQ